VCIYTFSRSLPDTATLRTPGEAQCSERKTRYCTFIQYPSPLPWAPVRVDLWNGDLHLPVSCYSMFTHRPQHLRKPRPLNRSQCSPNCKGSLWQSRRLRPMCQSLLLLWRDRPGHSDHCLWITQQFRFLLKLRHLRVDLSPNLRYYQAKGELLPPLLPP
jgi:hypothetical protein